jgi:hypothetical protein
MQSGVIAQKFVYTFYNIIYFYVNFNRIAFSPTA